MDSMSSSQNASASHAGFEQSETFAPLSAGRLLLLGGIALILIGMIFGDIFAVFVLHQNAARVGAVFRMRRTLLSPETALRSL